MLFAEKENNLLEWFRDISKAEIFLCPKSDQTENICESLRNNKRWQHWIDSSAKDAPPPDFYNDIENLMLEVMRVDDHGFVKDGKVINPTYSREHEMERELKKAGIINQFPNIQKVFINAVTDLPTNEDHNYQFYFENFQRIVSNHKRKINDYKSNHPNHQVIFFVFDESSAYWKSVESDTTVKEGKMIIGEPHIWFEDKRFVDVFYHSEIDYLIWVTPYKMLFNSSFPHQLPRACVFDCKNMTISLREYDTSFMVSVEE